MNVAVPVDGSCREQTSLKIKPPNQDQKKDTYFQILSLMLLQATQSLGEIPPYY